MRRPPIDFATLLVTAAGMALVVFITGRSLATIFLCVLAPAFSILPRIGPRCLTRLAVNAVPAGLFVGAIAAYVAGAAIAVQVAALSIALAAVTGGLTMALTRTRLPIEWSRAAAALVLLAWSSWPVWMAPRWTLPSVARVLDPLVAYQPLLAINGPCIDLGEWSHFPLAYKYLMNLGQDVAYELPTSAWQSVIAHAIVAAVLLGAARLPRRAKVPV